MSEVIATLLRQRGRVAMSLSDDELTVTVASDDPKIPPKLVRAIVEDSTLAPLLEEKLREMQQAVTS